MNERQVTRRQQKRRGDRAQLVLDLSAEELAILVSVARYYERSLGPMRHVVRLTAPTLRGRYRYMRDESSVLQQFAETMKTDLEEKGVPEMPVQFTLRALIAFWGRILASLQSKRSRRRLNQDQIQGRESLASRFQELAERVAATDPDAIESELQTRRPTEARWMRERLGP